MANELITIPQETIDALDNIAEHSLDFWKEVKPFSRSVQIATAMNQLREMLSGPILKQFVALKDTPLGFMTDKGMKDENKQFKKYTDEQIRDALIEAALKGVYPVGNQFNIIQGRCYITKEGFYELLKRQKGLKYSITPDVPKVDHGAGKGFVTLTVEWTYNGEHHSETMPFVVKVQYGMEEDAVIGKATRKARAWLYQTITGIEVGDGEVDDPKPGPKNDPNIIDVPQKEKPTLRKLVPKAKIDYEDEIKQAEDVDKLRMIYAAMQQDQDVTEERREELKAKCTQRKEQIQGGNK